ncbi:unnamed protein product, partial [Iphiclides podalirius]
MSEPVVVSLQRDYRNWWTTFPAITACFLERVQPEVAKKEIERLWNVTEDSDAERFQYYYGFIEQVADVSFRTNLQNFWKYQSDNTVKNIDLLDLARSVHPNVTLGVTLSQTNKEVQWIPVMTEEGLCFTLNSVYAEYQFLLKETEWNQQELLKCHYHSGQCFVTINSSSNVVRILHKEYFVHSPFDIATAISNPTGEVMPNEELVIDYKVVEIQAAARVKTLTPEQRRCRYPDEWYGAIKAYSFGLCQMSCRNRMALMFCGCRPYFNIKGDGDVCDAHGMACIGRNVEILINLPKNLAKCPCIPQCAELNYYSHTKKVSIRNETLDEEAAAIARYNLMPPKFRLHRDVIFSLEDLFASLGGTTALFVGASLLTVVETALFIIRLLPFGLDVGVLSVAAYFITRVRKPDPNNVLNIFGPDPWTKESELNPEKVVRCIAHRGAGLDAPENTMQAFKYCVDRDCNFIELDVRSSRDGHLVLLHDQGLERLTGTDINNVHIMNWDEIKNIDIGATHPNRQQYKEVHLCLFDEAIEFLLANNVRMIIDVKGKDQEVINGIVKAFSKHPTLYENAVVTTFNPFVLYKIRTRDPDIVGAISYRPYCFSAQDYDAESGPHNPRFGDNPLLHSVLRAADAAHSLLWRLSARWCGASAVLLHKDIVSPSEVQYWRSIGVRCAGWSVNRPLEKLYWRGVLKAPYLASTLLGEPDVDEQRRVEKRTIQEME